MLDKAPPLAPRIEIRSSNGRTFRATIMQEGLDDILGVLIFPRRGLDGFRRIQTLSLPGQTALNKPCQNARHFGPQFFRKVQVCKSLIWLCRVRVRHENRGERDQQNPPPQGLILRVRPRSVVRQKADLVRRLNRAGASHS